MVHVDLPHGVTVNAQCFTVICTKQFGERDVGNYHIILLHGSACPCTAELMKTILAHSPGLAPSDLQLFGSMKPHSVGQIFQTADELKCSILNWLCNQEGTCYATIIRKLPGRL